MFMSCKSIYSSRFYRNELDITIIQIEKANYEI
jgi:hypothetical protein